MLYVCVIPPHTIPPRPSIGLGVQTSTQQYVLIKQPAAATFNDILESVIKLAEKSHGFGKMVIMFDKEAASPQSSERDPLACNLSSLLCR